MRTDDRKRLPRRQVLKSAAAFLSVPLMTKGGLVLAAAPESGETRFVVFRNGDRFGRHVVRFRQEGEDLYVRIEIDFDVSFGPLTFFRYTHRNDEVWRGDRLIKLESTTNDDGDAYRVSARAEGDKLLVEGSSGQFELPGDTLSTSYWHEQTIARTQWLDTQKGRLVKSRVTEIGKEPISAGGGTLDAARYRLEGDIDCDLWYDRGRWVKLAFAVKDSEIDYRLEGPLTTTG